MHTIATSRQSNRRKGHNVERTQVYAFKGKVGDLLPDLFAIMSRAFSSPIPEGRSCLEIIDDTIRADSDAQGEVVAQARAATHEE